MYVGISSVHLSVFMLPYVAPNHIWCYRGLRKMSVKLFNLFSGNCGKVQIGVKHYEGRMSGTGVKLQ